LFERHNEEEFQVRALITGIAGFAGSHLAEYLLAETSLEVWGVLREHDTHIAHLRHRLHLLYGDLTDPDITQVILARTQPDYVFHLAGQAFVGESWDNPWATMEPNIRSQVNVLAVAADLGLEARLLVVGSNEEYGSIRPDDLPIDEDTPLRPNSPYGVSKVAQDFLGLQYHLSHGLHTVRVRPFNHIGPRQRDQFVVPSFARQIAEIEAGLRPPVMRVGNLSARRDFTDVRDTVRAYWLLLQHGQPGQVYNVGSGRAYSAHEILDALLSLTSTRIEVQVDPARLRPTDVPLSVCDASKLRAATGWQPSILLAQTLRDVLEEWRGKVNNS
jgi:GDP-4-dehydro-6-deoxy-D-mannose reductase